MFLIWYGFIIVLSRESSINYEAVILIETDEGASRLKAYLVDLVFKLIATLSYELLMNSFLTYRDGTSSGFFPANLILVSTHNLTYQF